jgi:hypothetical protein
MSRSEDQALYGGAKGGGKSDALLAEALMQVDKPHYRAAIFRKEYPQLADLVDRSIEIYSASYPDAKYNDSKHCWTFPSGAKIYFQSMPHPKDRHKYQGRHFDYIGVDELTHFTREEYMYLVGLNRPNGPGMRCYIRATANPGGIGHGWVMEMFINPAPPMTTMWEPAEYNDPVKGKTVKWVSRIYIPATVFDNRKLMENDPTYVARLASLPEKEKNAFLYGRWDTFEGQVYTEWKNEPKKTEDGIEYPNLRYTHVIEPIPIKANWRIYCGLDWGSRKPFAVGWFAVDEDGRIYFFKEYYGSNGTPDVGLKLTVPEVAREIKRLEAEDDRICNVKRISRIADTSIFDEDGGESQSQVFDKFGVYWERADKKRIPGWSQIHDRLRFDEKGYPMFYVFTNCRNFIRTFPALVYSETTPEDVDTKQEDHLADMVRYICMANPLKARIIVPPKPPLAFDPLNQDPLKQKTLYL